MEIINAATVRMEEIEIFTIPALFTPYRVDRATVPAGLACYEVRVRAGAPRRTFSLMEQAPDGDLYGTVLVPVPVDLPEDGEKPIGPGDFLMETGAGYHTPAEFEAKYLSPDYKD